MDASPNGCKWVCGWVDVEERPTHKELTGLSGWDAGNWLKSVDGWENNGCKRTMDASECVDGWEAGKAMDASPNGCKWVAWMGRQPRNTLARGDDRVLGASCRACPLYLVSSGRKGG